ncbi:MAG: hypothetical protein AAGD04_03435 [Pseudomonadota bacterium]
MNVDPTSFEPNFPVGGLGGQDAKRYAATLRQVAVFQMTHGALPMAERLTRVALWLDPETGRNWRLRAHCLARMNNPREALRLLSQARSRGIGGIGLRDLLSVGWSFARSGYLAEARKFLLFEK